jgi:hypothetical protein
VFVAEGVSMNWRLDDEADLESVMRVLERIADGVESEEARRRRQAAKGACPSWAAPWSALLNDGREVEALLFVAVEIRSSESGFLNLSNARELANEAFGEEPSPWSRTFLFKDFFSALSPSSYCRCEEL